MLRIFGQAEVVGCCKSSSFLPIQKAHDEQLGSCVRADLQSERPPHGRLKKVKRNWL
jgi:hypothetical protein